MTRKTQKLSRDDYESKSGATALYETADRSSDRGNQDSLTQEHNQPTEDRQGNRNVIDAVESSTELLQQLLEQFSCLQAAVNAEHFSPPASEPEFLCDTESEQLRDRIVDLEDQVAELERQNSDLASRVANSNIREAVSTVGPTAANRFLGKTVRS